MNSALLDRIEAAGPYVNEFVGTFFIVFVSVLTLALAPTVWTPTAIGFSIMVLMYATSHETSVSHLNPLISLAFGLCGKDTWSQVARNCIIQLIAGVAAGAAGIFLLGSPAFPSEYEFYGVGAVAIFTLVYSTMMCFVALNTMALHKDNPIQGGTSHVFALAVGFVAIAGGHAIGTTAGGYFNPAIALGCVWSNAVSIQMLIINLAMQLLGSICASLLYFLIRPSEIQAVLGFGPRAGEGTFNFARACAAINICAGIDRRPPPRASAGLAENFRDATFEGNTVLPVAEPKPIWTTEAWGRQEIVTPLASKVCSEFVGAFLITLTFGVSALTDAHHVRIYRGAIHDIGTGQLNPQRDWHVADDATDYRNTQVYPWAAGAAFLSLAYSLGDVSGGYFNPAFTLGALISRRDKSNAHESFLYLLVQFCGSLAAGVLYAGVASYWQLTSVIDDVDLGAGRSHPWNCIVLAEVIMTGAVTLIFLCVRTVTSARYPRAPRERSFQHGLAIGLSIAASGMAIDHISGGFLNPALVFGVSVANFSAHHFSLSMPDGASRLTYMLWYMLWEAVGCVAAALIFMVCHPFEYTADILQTEPLTATRLGADQIRSALPTYASIGEAPASARSDRPPQAAPAGEGEGPLSSASDSPPQAAPAAV